MNEIVKKLIIPPITPAAPGPLYEQIVSGIKREIRAGRLQPGQPLPSFRNLAEELMVSLITVKRAYEELEREGLIFRKQGLGTFVAEDGLERCREGKRMEAMEWMEKAVQGALDAGMNTEEIVALVRHQIQTLQGETS
jgi:GntR family transcriptional regulator